MNSFDILAAETKKLVFAMQPNLRISLAAIIAASFFSLGNPATAQPAKGMGTGPDFSAAAESLGITEDELRSALGGPPPNFSEAAKKLGISEEKLAETLPPPPEGGPPHPPQ